MRYESALVYLELFLSTAIFEIELIWSAVVFDSLSDWYASISPCELNEEGHTWSLETSQWKQDKTSGLVKTSANWSLPEINQTSKVLGSKTLGTNVLELQFVYVGKPWSKHLV